MIPHIQPEVPLLIDITRPSSPAYLFPAPTSLLTSPPSPPLLQSSLQNALQQHLFRLLFLFARLIRRCRGHHPDLRQEHLRRQYVSPLHTTSPLPLLTYSSLLPHNPTLYHRCTTPITRLPSYQCARVRSPLSLRRQAPHITRRTAIELQRHQRKHSFHGSSPSRWRAKESPVQLQGLQGCGPAHCGRLWLLLWPLLRQTPHARVSQLPRFRRLQARGEGQEQGKARERAHGCH